MLAKLYNTYFGTVIDTTPDITELVVCILKSVYFSATAPSFHLLCDRIRNSDVIEKSGWGVTGISYNVLKKLVSGHSFSISILPDYSFVIDVGEHCLDNCLCLPLTTINSVDSLLKLLGMIDECSLCQGNSNDKFRCAQERRKGKFFDRTGMYMYYNKPCINVNCHNR